MNDPKPNSPEDIGFRPRKAVTFPIPTHAPVSRCRSCGQAVVWIVTSNNRRMPVELGQHRGESHFAHCPHAAQHRRPR